MAHCKNMILAELMIVVMTLYFRQVEGAQLQALPTQIVLGGQNPTSLLRLTCRPTTSGLTSVIALEIGKRTSGGDNSQNQNIVQLEGAGQVVIKDSLGNRIESSAGSISGTTGYLEVTIKELQCSDAAVPYYCSATINAGSIRTEYHDVNITVISNPGSITMITTPNSVIYGNLPVLVDFTCTGLIGNQFDPNQQNNMANYWFWEWRTVDDFNSQQWVRYPNSNNITYRDPTPTSGNCQYNGGTTLLHNVTSLDNGRQFRCYFLREEYGDNRTVYTQAAPVTGGPCGVVDCAEGQCPTPKDFFCTEHNQSSVTLQWLFNGTKCSLKFDLKFRHDKERNWKAVVTSQQDRQLEILHNVTIAQLKSNSLYFFRLSVDGDQAVQTEAITTTCFTQQANEDPLTNLSSPRNRVGAGFALMLLFRGLCLQQI